MRDKKSMLNKFASWNLRFPSRIIGMKEFYKRESQNHKIFILKLLFNQLTYANWLF